MIATPSRSDGLSTYIDVDEAAQLLGRPPATVRDYIRKGRLRARKFGPRIWRVERASVEEHLAPVSAPQAEKTPYERVLELLPQLADADLRQVALRALSRAA